MLLRRGEIVDFRFSLTDLKEWKGIRDLEQYYHPKPKNYSDV